MRAKEWRRGVLIGLLIILILWLGSLIWGLAGKARVAITQARETKAQFEELEVRKAKLQADLTELQTPRGQEAAIREAFGVAKAGEEVIVVVPPVEATSTPPLPWWERMFDWL